MNKLWFWLVLPALIIGGYYIFQKLSSEKDAPASAEESGQAGSSAVQRVRLSTTMGEIVLALDASKAPITVENFMKYVDAKFYDNTIFHRVIPDFMIQGGGFTADMSEKPNNPEIKNEADNGLLNKRGTISMARTNEINSATSQFFINHKDNAFLDHGPQGFGYAVFGAVESGMDVVDKIAAVSTENRGPHQNVPQQNVVIISAERID